MALSNALLSHKTTSIAGTRYNELLGHIIIERVLLMRGEAFSEVDPAWKTYLDRSCFSLSLPSIQAHPKSKRPKPMV